MSHLETDRVLISSLEDLQRTIQERIELLNTRMRSRLEGLEDDPELITALAQEVELVRGLSREICILFDGAMFFSSPIDVLFCLENDPSDDELRQVLFFLKKHGYTQTKIAKAIGSHQGFISRFMTGRRPFPLELRRPLISWLKTVVESMRS